MARINGKIDWRRVAETAAWEAVQEYRRSEYWHNMQRVYLYYRPANSNEMVGKLLIAPDAQHPFVLANSEPVPLNADNNQRFNWVRFRIGGLPILNVTE